MANWSQARGQTKNGSKDLMEDCGRRLVSLPGGNRGPLLEPGPEGGPASERLVAGHATEPGHAQPEKTTWTSSASPLLCPVGSPLTGKTARVRCAARQVAVKAEGLDRPDPRSRGWIWGCGTSPLLGERSRSW